jgi:serine/threonine protein kinase
MAVLKCISRARASEIETLEFLYRTPSPHHRAQYRTSLVTTCNHTIPFTRILCTQDDIVISMPYYQPLNKWHTITTDAATDLGRQLLEAVHFMHTRGVAHRDLKPENVVADVATGRLFIIDYGLATRVRGRHDVTRGFVGTDGFTAPEVVDSGVGRGFYSPIAADLWATGNILHFLLSHTESKSPVLKRLQMISSKLLNDDPSQRPSAGDMLALQRAGSILSHCAPKIVHPSSKRPRMTQV